jgi:hypothetical protein
MGYNSPLDTFSQPPLLKNKKWNSPLEPPTKQFYQILMDSKEYSLKPMKLLSLFKINLPQLSTFYPQEILKLN